MKIFVKIASLAFAGLLASSCSPFDEDNYLGTAQTTTKELSRGASTSDSALPKETKKKTKTSIVTKKRTPSSSSTTTTNEPQPTLPETTSTTSTTSAQEADSYYYSITEPIVVNGRSFLPSNQLPLQYSMDDQIRDMYKTIGYCGTRGIEEVGTTWFTDGTTGWTTECSTKMLNEEHSSNTLSEIYREQMQIERERRGNSY